MAKRILVTVSLAMMAFFIARSQLIIDHAHFTSLYNKGQYKQLFNETSQIRISKEYGKNWMIDYYMTISLCGMGNTTLAGEGFDYILKEYPLHPRQKQFVEQSSLLCHPPDNGIGSGSRIKMAYLVLNNSNSTKYPVAIVTGKLGPVLDCSAKLEEYQFNPSFDNAELQKRLFRIDEKDSALTYYREFLPESSYNVNQYERYIFITRKPATLTNTEVENAARELEKVYRFYVERYGIRPPDKLITVYLMGNLSNLRDVALITHGLKIPDKSYGYSCADDLSVLGNSSKAGLGTIKHELFHLMIRTDIGDIPGWLDEGIASMYEESHWDGSLLRYDDNLWRTDVLKQNSAAAKPFPLIRTLITNNWDEFTPGNNTTLCELSVNYAMAKHFAMFLEDYGDLQKVVEAFKNRKSLFTGMTSVALNNYQILEGALNRELSFIQKDFDDWLFTKFKILPHRDKTTVMQRVAHLDEIIDVVCPSRPDKASFLEACGKLKNDLSVAGPELPDELYERSLKLIAQAEKIYAECEHH